MNLPVLPLILAILGLLIGFVRQYIQNRKDINWKNILSWSFKGFIFGLFAWVIYICLYNIFGFTDIPLISNTFSAPGTGLDLAGL